MKLKYISLILLILCYCSYCALAQTVSDKMKPRWITSILPKNISPSYTFINASGTGGSLEEARQRAFVNLTTKLEHERGIKVSSSVKVKSNSQRIGGRRSQQSSQIFQMECTEDGKNITLNTRVIDEYWEREKTGSYTCYILYTVADNNLSGGSYDDDIWLTTSYGAKGFFMSLIPGVGQLYKGSKLKGGLILSGTAACTGMIIASENMRSSYIKKMQEKTVYKAFYNDKVDTWCNVRNGFIGAVSALYIYNLIDAAVAPGRRRVIVKKGKTVHWGLVPTWEKNMTGMSLVMNF